MRRLELDQILLTMLASQPEVSDLPEADRFHWVGLDTYFRQAGKNWYDQRPITSIRECEAQSEPQLIDTVVATILLLLNVRRNHQLLNGGGSTSPIGKRRRKRADRRRRG